MLRIHLMEVQQLWGQYDSLFTKGRHESQHTAMHEASLRSTIRERPPVGAGSDSEFMLDTLAGLHYLNGFVSFLKCCVFFYVLYFQGPLANN